MEKPVMEFGDLIIMGWEQVAGGYAGGWATENNREAIFDAIERKEAYATTGSRRMMVRFFGGWDFEPEDARTRLPGDVDYFRKIPNSEFRENYLRRLP